MTSTSPAVASSLVFILDIFCLPARYSQSRLSHPYVVAVASDVSLPSVLPNHILRMLRTSLLRRLTQSSRLRLSSARALSTLQDHPHIYVVENPQSTDSHLLTLLSTEPPIPAIALGTTSQLPPTTSSFRTNERFITILNSVLAQHAHEDKMVQSQAAALASSAGSTFMLTNRRQRTGSAGASDQGGAGGGGMGGWIHVSDLRHPPDYGRIAEPEDIFGSLEVDGQGQFVDGHGRYQASGTYRIVTRDGVLGLTNFMRAKLVERLKVEEANERNRKADYVDD